ncbi:MAG: sugar phosphate isomerase/epimerase [Actinobacteria bacterium]|nr:sugar phosphate isomerase/epimerase [Actinomycetota bacterium]
MTWQPRFSVGLYHHVATNDRPTNAQIDAAFAQIDRIPDVAGVEVFSGTCVTPENAAHVKRRLDERGLQCTMAHHGAPYVWGALKESAFIAPDPKERREAIQMWLNAVDVARALGGLGIYVFTPMDGQDYPFQTDFRSARQYTADALHEICAAAGDLKVALEFRPYAPRGWATVGSTSKVLELIAELKLSNLGVQLEVSHTLMSLENVAQAAWEAAQRGRLYHVHLNDTQLPQDLSTIFGSHHLWESLELLYWLREAGYPYYLGLDVVWTREEPVRSSTQFIRNAQFLLRVLDAIDVAALTRAMARHDILTTQDMLWKALRETS